MGTSVRLSSFLHDFPEDLEGEVTDDISGTGFLLAEGAPFFVQNYLTKERSSGMSWVFVASCIHPVQTHILVSIIQHLKRERHRSLPYCNG